MMAIHSALLEGVFPNATSLAADLEVSTRTIMRDLDFMRDRLELPIEFHAPRNGFQYTREVKSFPTLKISEGELFALMLAEKALEQYRGTPFEKPLLTVFEKITQSLPESISFNVGEWEGTVSFRTSAEPIIDVKTFDALAKAITRGEQLVLHYRKPGLTRIEQRKVDPYHLANINGEWFLFAFDHLRKAIRTFVPARIQKIEKSGERFEKDPKFSIEKELRDSFGVFSGRGNHRVVVQFNELVADYIREKKWHPSQQLAELPDGGVQLTMTLSTLAEVQRWILSWGGNARVVEPAELRTNVRIAAERLLAGAVR